MATYLRISSGSIFAGNPITIACSAKSVSNPTFHRVVFEVTANGHTFKSSQPVITEGGIVQIDISSAIRAVFDNYEWSPLTTTPPSCQWTVKAYDEYMLEGELYPHEDEVTLSGGPSYPGGFSDLERISSSGGSINPSRFTRKPTVSPETVCVGDDVCVPATGGKPSSTIVSVSTEGQQESVNAFAITPKSKAEQRTQIRFINGFGCLESISVPRASQKASHYKMNRYVVTKRQAFNNPSHAVVQKQSDNESWRFTSGPVDEHWQQWFLHDFLVAEHAWIYVGRWLRIHIVPEESITYLDEDKQEIHEVIFQAEFDINGSPTLLV